MVRPVAVLAVFVAPVFAGCSTGERQLDPDCERSLEVEPLVLPVAELTEQNQAGLTDVGLRAIVTDRHGDPDPGVRVTFAFGDDPDTNEAVAVSDDDGIAFEPASELGFGPILEVNTEGSYRAHIVRTFCSTVSSGSAPITFDPPGG